VTHIYKLSKIVKKDDPPRTMAFGEELSYFSFWKSGFALKKGSRALFRVKAIAENLGHKFFLRQIPFYLRGNVRYVCDFQIFWANGTVTFEDFKGMKPPTYKAKKKMVEAIYPIHILEA
jgi:hypothetical protein